jgi:hypothetical protein
MRQDSVPAFRWNLLGWVLSPETYRSIYWVQLSSVPPENGDRIQSLNRRVLNKRQDYV